LHKVFVLRLGDHVVVRSAGSVHLPPDSAPEPDVVLLRYRDDFYRTVRTLPADVLLAVEVAESSLRYDRLVKIPLYAGRGILEAWIVDVEGECVEIYREPTPAGYRQHQRVPRGAAFSPEVFPDLALTVADILG
jgi:Uma2 family endonuclease